MKNFKDLMTIFILTLFSLALISPAALAANIIIDKEAGSADPGFFHTPNYANDATCIQAALDYSKSGDTITICKGDYYITKGVYQKNKNLNIIGEGKVTLHIQTSDKVYNDIYFGGSQIISGTLSADVKKGSSQVVLTDASKVRKNDLIKIWKNVPWCPLNYPDNYPDQMTGEIYAVKSVNGNVVTLNQPLLRDYKLSETVKFEVYRPVQMHIKNIRLEDTGASMSHHGLVMQYCKDSSITNSWFNECGFGAICLYSCFNVSVNNNEIYNSLLPGSGYGVNVASGTAFANIEHNHIENCRHAITGNSAELKSLSRDVFIADNTLIGANITGSNVVDAHADTIDFVVTRNKIYPQVTEETLYYCTFLEYRSPQELPFYFAFSDGTQQSTFSNNEVFGGYGGIFSRGAVGDGVHVYENNTFNDMLGNMYEGGNGTDGTLIIRNNTQNGGTRGVIFPFYGGFKNIIISKNTFSNLSHQGVYQKFLINGINLDISKNTFENLGREGIYIDGNSLKNGAVKIQNNILTDVNTSNSSSGITVKNVKNPDISGNKIFQNPIVPVAAFFGSPNSGKAPLKVQFYDKSTGSPTFWFWKFGDGSKSYLQNPVHKYSKAGTYTVSLTVKNAKGKNTVTKTNYIKVITKSVAAFSATPSSGKAPLNVKFTDKSTGSPTKWKWDFGDGSKSFHQNPTHKYSKAGVYTVSLTVKNAKGSNTVTKTGYITVAAKPVAAFSASPSSGKAPLKVKFTDKSTGTPAKWIWDFGDGSKSFHQNPVHKYSKKGTYSVSLTVNNAVGRNAVTKTKYIKVV
ncbi:Chitin binding protein [Methanosarcina barkeri str. Wiesmoor]|uniref:Chitin binding protein n=2 Tax=Methanosarcina barkeri TaxID=2208 RepID=A0A0E3QLI6_METBA|nr:Chitin binding protein [Methanosarcina barkeri str. Wiesmoor]